MLWCYLTEYETLKISSELLYHSFMECIEYQKFYFGSERLEVKFPCNIIFTEKVIFIEWLLYFPSAGN